MTPAQQKKEYQKALKQQQDAVKKAQSDRKKKEQQPPQAVKEQKKKSKAKQEEPKPDEKQPPSRRAPVPAAGPRTPPGQTMSRILLVDDSPHAQRMGERILSEEGYEVVTVSNADSALIRLDDVDPDVVLADTVMPGRTGYEICQYLKMSPRHRHVRVILTAGVMETLDEAAVARVEADATLRKPFEASALLAAVKPLAEAAAQDRAAVRACEPGAGAARSAAADGRALRRRDRRGTGARRRHGGPGCVHGGDGGRDRQPRAGGAGHAETRAGDRASARSRARHHARSGQASAKPRRPPRRPMPASGAASAAASQSPGKAAGRRVSPLRSIARVSIF